MELMSFENSENGSERRSGVPAAPFGIEARLTELQRLAINRFANFGWSLAFVRRPEGSPWTVVMRGPEGSGYAILNEQGDLDRHAPLVVRN